MKEIPLTRGFVALVDDEDFDRLTRHRWFAMCKGNQVYAVRVTSARLGRRRRIYMQHEILPPLPGKVVDHRNLSGVDNRKGNLRYTGRTGNSQNRRKWGTGSSRFKGVCWLRSRWIAYISANKKRFHLGTFDNEEDAARAYNRAAEKRHGVFACLNPV